MPKSERCRRKDVGDRGIDVGVVAFVIVEGVDAQQGWQPLIVGDRLDLGCDDRPGLLIDLFVC